MFQSVFHLLSLGWRVAADPPWVFEVLCLSTFAAIAMVALLPRRWGRANALTLATICLLGAFGVDVALRRDGMTQQYAESLNIAEGSDLASMLSMADSIDVFPHYVLAFTVCVVVAMGRYGWSGGLSRWSSARALLLAVACAVPTALGAVGGALCLDLRSADPAVPVLLASTAVATALQWWWLSRRSGDDGAVDSVYWLVALLIPTLPVLVAGSALAVEAGWPRGFGCYGPPTLMTWEHGVWRGIGGLVVGWWGGGVPGFLLGVIACLEFRRLLPAVSALLPFLGAITVALVAVVGLLWVCTGPVPYGAVGHPWDGVTRGVDVPEISDGTDWSAPPRGTHIVRWTGSAWERFVVPGSGRAQPEELVVAPPTLLGRDLPKAGLHNDTIQVLVTLHGPKARWSLYGRWRSVFLHNDSGAPSVAHLPLSQILQQCRIPGYYGGPTTRCSW